MRSKWKFALPMDPNELLMLIPIPAGLYKTALIVLLNRFPLWAYLEVWHLRYHVLKRLIAIPIPFFDKHPFL